MFTKIKRQRLLAALLTCALSISFSAQAIEKKAEAKIATVDVQQAILQTNEGKAAREKLEKEVTQKKKDLQAQEAQLKKLQDDFLAQQNILSEADKQAKQKDFVAKVQAFQQTQAALEQDARQKEATALNQIYQNMQGEIKKIANQKQFDMVFDKSAGALLYSLNAVDITSDVVEVYNKEYKPK